jgi:hypothetical protein
MAELLGQHFAEVVAALKSASPNPAAQELRRAPRIEINAKVVTWPLTDNGAGEAVTMLARDISFRGIGLVTAHPMPSNSRFAVGLPRGRFEPICVVCTCMHAREIADGIFMIGAQFLEVIVKKSTGAAA